MSQSSLPQFTAVGFCGLANSKHKIQNIIKNFENLQRNSDIIESGLRGNTKQMKARVKILEQGTVRDRD